MQAGGALMGQMYSRVGLDVWVITLVLLLITSAVAGLGMFDLFFRSSARGKIRVPLSSLVVNPVFWVNVLYQGTILVVIVRLVAFELELVGRKLALGGRCCAARRLGFACCWLVARALTKAVTVGVRVAFCRSLLSRTLLLSVYLFSPFQLGRLDCRVDLDDHAYQADPA